MLKEYPTLRHVLGRAGWYFLTFLVAVTLNFVLPRLGDANPVDVVMSKVSGNMDAKTAQEKEEGYLKEFGLVEVDGAGKIVRDGAGKPIKSSIVAQFGNYLGMSLRGDFGTSIHQYPKKVSEIIKTAIPWTIALQLPTIVFGWILGNILGALAAYKRGIFDRGFYPLALLASAVPAFCFGILLVYFFAIRMEWFPPAGGYSEGLTQTLSWEFVRSASYYYVLPFLSVFIPVV